MQDWSHVALVENLKVDTASEIYERMQAYIASAPPPLTWNLLAGKERQAAADLRQKVDEFGETLPPGSAVAVRREPVDLRVMQDNVLRLIYTLRPVFPGQEYPQGEEWMVFVRRTDTYFALLQRLVTNA